MTEMGLTMKAGAMCMISRAQAQETRDCTHTLHVCAGCIFKMTLPLFQQPPLVEKDVPQREAHH